MQLLSFMTKPDISFVLLTWNSEDYIEKCLNSIFKAFIVSKFSYEIFIVDNGSIDNTVKILEFFKNKYPEFIKLIFLDKNTGTTYPRNLALKKASGQYVCIMDSDVEIFPGAIDKLIKNLDRQTDIGLSVPKIVYPNGKLQKSTDVFPTITRKFYRYLFLKKIESSEASKITPKSLTEVDYAISAIWLLKRKVITEIGFLDENIFYAPEDVDYCIRIWKAGYKVVYDNSISVIHHTQEISRGFKINKAFISHIKGLLYYFIKHRYFLRPPSFRIKTH